MPSAATVGRSHRPFEHAVDLYATSGELAGRVAGYLGSALGDGDAAIVVATDKHRKAIAAALTSLGVDVDAARRASTLVELDAAGTLRRITRHGRVDHARFAHVIGDLIGAAGAEGRTVRVYGEMVALLWADGLIAGALELEMCWNELSEIRPFSLYCSYPQDLLHDVDHADHVAAMCRLHTRVTGVAAGRDDDPAGPATSRTSRFSVSVESPAAAREFVAQVLRNHDGDAIVDDAVLVVSELVTNAVRHAHSPTAVTVRTSGTTVRIEVSDHGTEPPVPGVPPTDATSGRGLSIVAAVAAEWGHHTTVDGKTVWAELRLRAGGHVADAFGTG